MMRTSQKVKNICLLLIAFSLAASPALAQITYRFKADLQKIDSNGTYKIKLKPGLVAKCNESLSDIRLLDQNGKFIAHALSKNIFIDNPENFIEFPEVNSNANSDTAAIFIAENKNGINTGQLWIKLKNTDVSRSVDLSGSDDLKKWFAIKEDIPLEKAGPGNEPEYQQSLYFPTSNYQYFKLQVHGRNKTPVKIIRAGIYISSSAGPGFEMLPPVKFNFKDTGNVSHVYLHFDEPYLINKLHLVISTPNYYSRHINIYDTQNGSKVCDATIGFPGSQDIYFSAKTTHLRIDISNGDDVPLTIKKIEAFQQEQYVTSYLEAGHRYSILCGDSLAKEANYDLSFLKHKPYNQLPVISHSVVYRNPAYVIPKPTAKSNFTLLLWITIAVVLILLSFLTWRMVKEINLKRT